MSSLFSRNQTHLHINSISIEKTPNSICETSLKTRRKSMVNLTEGSTKISMNKTLNKKRPSIFVFDSQNKKVRHDAYGNEISKGNKNHKVSFIDSVSNLKLAEIIIIEQNNNYNDHTTCECKASCLIF